MVIIHEPISYIFILIFAPNVAWGLFTLKLRSYIFRLESRKAEDREVYTCTHEHSWKRGSHESKVSISPSVPNLEIIKFTSYHYYLLLTLKNVGRLQHREQQHEQLTHDGLTQGLDATSKPIHITSVLPIIRSVRNRVFTSMPSSSMMHDGCIMYFSFLSSRRLKDQLELEQKK